VGFTEHHCGFTVHQWVFTVHQWVFTVHHWGLVHQWVYIASRRFKVHHKCLQCIRGVYSASEGFTVHHIRKRLQQHHPPHACSGNVGEGPDPVPDEDHGPLQQPAQLKGKKRVYVNRSINLYRITSGFNKMPSTNQTILTEEILYFSHHLAALRRGGTVLISITSRVRKAMFLLRQLAASK
jgi:hypothetical protein